MMKPMDTQRRYLNISAMASVGLGLAGCNRYDDPTANPSPGELAPMTPEQEIIMAARARMLKKFASIGGVGLEFGAKVGREFLGVTFYRENTNRPFYRSAALWRETRERGTSKFSSAVIAAIPERARVTWREDEKGNGDDYTSKIIGEHSIHVGLGVPDTVIEGIRKKRGGLQLKFMLAEETCYFGWHVMREAEPGWKPPKMHRTDIGGNFCEAFYDHQEKFVKGWYIHPKTGQRIETDF
jgi:hypothetical protein